MTSSYTPTEIMTIAAARALRNDDVCFVGIGAPSAACNLARLTHAPGITLIRWASLGPLRREAERRAREELNARA